MGPSSRAAASAAVFASLLGCAATPAPRPVPVVARAPAAARAPTPSVSPPRTVAAEEEPIVIRVAPRAASDEEPVVASAPPRREEEPEPAPEPVTVPALAPETESELGPEELVALGRALEASGGPGARLAYCMALAKTGARLDPLPGDLDALRFLARESALRAAVGRIAWRVERSPHFVFFYAPGEGGEPLGDYEAARAAALARLGLREEQVPHAALVPVFVFADRVSFEAASPDSPEWATGGAEFSGELIERAIYITRCEGLSLAQLVRHEAAHVFAGEAFGAEHVPTWAAEGIACFAEDDGERAHHDDYLAFATEISIEGLARTTYEDLSNGTAYGFYARSHAAFSALCDKAGGPGPAILVARAMYQHGTENGLRAAKLDVRSLDEEILAALRARRAARVVAVPPAVVTTSAPRESGGSGRVLVVFALSVIATAFLIRRAAMS